MCSRFSPCCLRLWSSKSTFDVILKPIPPMVHDRFVLTQWDLLPPHGLVGGILRNEVLTHSHAQAWSLRREGVAALALQALLEHLAPGRLLLQDVALLKYAVGDGHARLYVGGCKERAYAVVGNDACAVGIRHGCVLVAARRATS